MATSIRYNPGGYEPAAAAQNKAEQWTNATQPGDPTPTGYTAWDAQGNVTAMRALTGAEVTMLAAQDAAGTANANQATLRQRAQTALTNNQTALTNAASALTALQAMTVPLTTAEQTQLLTIIEGLVTGYEVTLRQLTTLIHLAIQEFTITAGT